MHNITKWGTTIVLLLGLISTPSLANSDINLLEYSKNKSDNIVLNGIAYTPHAPISISSNADFISLGFNGSGTSVDPYLIMGYNITGTSGSLISISSTTVSFEIKYNLLNGTENTLRRITHINVMNG